MVKLQKTDHQTGPAIIILFKILINKQMVNRSAKLKLCSPPTVT